MQWRIELLGGLRAVRGERVVSRWRSAKTGALLAWLALHLEQEQPRDALVELLWPDQPPERGRASLRTALAALRRELEPRGVPEGSVLAADRASVRLAGASCDAVDLERELQVAGKALGDGRRAALARAVALHRGELCPGLWEEFAVDRRRTLRGAVVRAATEAARLDADAGEPERALEHARRAVALDPTDEAARVALAELHLAAGRPAEARRELLDLERRLAAEGLGPSRAARHLLARVDRDASASGRLPLPASTPAATGLRVLLAVPAAEAAGGPAEVVGDAAVFAFPGPAEAAAAALAHAGRGALHVGTVAPAARAARLLAAARPGQLLCSEAAAAVLREAQPGLVDAGRWKVPGEPVAEHLFVLRGEPTPAAAPAHPARVPAAPDALRGREAAVERVRRALDEARLVTLTGPGGCGKSRVALEVAAQLRGPLRDAVWFVPLADQPLLLPAVVQALGVRTTPGEAPALDVAAALPEGRSLLVLDGLEPRLGRAGDGGPAALRELLARAPGLRLLVTSRRRLGLEGERVLPLEPLGLDAAAALFLDRAGPVRPGLARDATVDELCRRLDGLPLAVELAAAWAGTLAPAELLARLEARPDEVLRRRGRPGVREAFAATLDLLPRPLEERARDLSVFRGGFALEDADAVCGPDLETLDELAQAGLLAPAGDGRRRLPERVRQLLHERLDPARRAELERRHRERFAALADEAGVALLGPERARWLARLEPELANARAALQADGDPEAALRLVAGLWRVWQATGRSEEGWQLAREAVRHATGASPLLAAALGGAGILALQLFARDEAVALFERSLAVARRTGDARTVARALNGLGIATRARNEYARSKRLLEEALPLAREVSDGALESLILMNLGFTAVHGCEYREALALAEDALRRQRGGGNGPALANTLRLVGSLLHALGEPSVARARLDEALVVARQHAVLEEEGQALFQRAVVARGQGDLPAARADLEASVELCRRAGSRQALAHALGRLAVVLAELGEPWRGPLDEASALARACGSPVTLAITLRCGAEVALGERRWHEARAGLLEGARIDLRVANVAGAGASLEKLVQLHSARGEHARAARLQGALDALRARLGTRPPAADARRQEAQLAAARAALGAAATDEALAAGRALDPARAIDEA